MQKPNTPPLPQPPSGDFFDETQWAVLLSILDAVVPSLVPESSVTDENTQVAVPNDRYDEVLEQIQTRMAEPAPDEVVRAYLAERPAGRPEFKNHLRRTIASLGPAAQRQLGGVLTALSSRTGSFMLTGSTVPIHERPLQARADVLRAWDVSWFRVPRVLFKSFTSLAQASWVQTSPLFRQASGYPDVPHNWRPGPAAEYSFLQFPSASDKATSAPVVIDTDVVIVGSGCGGAVCAKVLAEAGRRVVVVDKGYYFTPDQLPMPQEQGSAYLYENGGFLQSVDGSINMVAGSCWGGGGTVNWSVSLQTQGFVRREWAEKDGLPFFQSAAFQDCLDRVCDYMGARDTSGVRQSHRGQVILDGAHRLGWPARVCPQNSGGAEHSCGHCHLGCASAEKQGPAVSWLPAAARAGAQFIEGFNVERILWDDDGSTGGAEKRAIGVVGSWTSRDANGGVSGPLEERTIREIVIKAKRVIVSAGALNSPLLLTRSGLSNRHIGRNLHLHPVNFVGAYYKEDIRPWEGGIITSYCSNFENLDGQGHGVKLEGTCMMPYTVLTQIPWRGPLDYKLTALRYRHLDAFISLTRDRDAGRVFAGPDGRPCVEYTPSAFDAAHTLEGLLGLAQLCYVTGATEIHAFLPGAKPFIRADEALEKATPTPPAMDLGVGDPTFQAWLASLRAVGNRPPTAPFSSAHQMGTCRMSSYAGEGVVDARGRVWDTKGLYIADASVFPSASGVNPMVTTMAIADWIAQGIAAEMADAEHGE